MSLFSKENNLDAFGNLYIVRVYQYIEVCVCVCVCV